jgi:hypothetical protein
MLLGGAVTDRKSPRKIMLVTASTRTIFVAGIGVLLWLHLLRTSELYLLAFAFGVADAFAAPAGEKFLPFLVAGEHLLPAGSLLTSTAQIFSIVAPAPAGIAIKSLGLAGAFLIDAISFLFILGVLWWLPDPPPGEMTQDAERAIWHDIVAGVGYVLRDIPLRTLMLVALILNFCVSGPMEVGVVYLVKARFTSPAAFGIVLSSLAAGGLSGSLLAGVWRVRRRGLLILCGCFALSVLVSCIGWLDSLWLMSSVVFLMGTISGWTNVHIITWVQQRAETAVRGRVMSLLMFSDIGLLPLSLFIAGLLVSWNVRYMFLFAAAGMLLVTAAAAFQGVVRLIE